MLTVLVCSAAKQQLASRIRNAMQAIVLIENSSFKRPSVSIVRTSHTHYNVLKKSFDSRSILSGSIFSVEEKITLEGIFTSFLYI